MASAVSALSWAPTQAGLLASVIDPTSDRMLLVHALAAARATPAWQNPAMRPFRFLATVEEFVDFAELTSLARQAEATGCSALVMPDHLIKQHAALPLLAMVAATEEKIGWIRAAAGDRFGDLELNTYPVGGPMVVTSDPRAEAGRRADRIRQRPARTLRHQLVPHRRPGRTGAGRGRARRPVKPGTVKPGPNGR